MSEERDARLGRRRLLRAGAGAVGAGLVGTGAAGTAVAQSGPFGGWMSDVSNYDGVHDHTGSGEVTVEVGVEANQGAFGFGPAAIQVDPGTTVVWEWTGEGGVHNVAADSGNFSSELKQEAGFTFEHTFESSGAVKYFCQPHKALGMKGVVVVGDAVPDGAEVVAGSGGGGGGGSGSGGETGSSGSGGSEGDGSSGGLNQGGVTMSLVVGGSLVAAFLSPIVFGLVLLLRDKTGGPPSEAGAEHGEPSHED
ncbi:halocyanin domain-containing protein [Haloplanus natans]|uniref:halocyanin domain-containing protein n=1 Tax=Haloplanus natans TaxID=376171 RepID=UPI000678157A|nr:halocyanin domain-containing protein [Haloplanus natans]